MLLDITGTRFYQGKLILPEEWRLDKNRPLQWWMPQGDQTIYKVVVRSLKGDILWQRPFGDDLVEALKFQHDFLCGERIGDCPSFDTAVHCAVENVCLFLSVGTQTWHCPDGVTPTNRLPLIYPPGDPQHDPELWEATSGSFTATNSTAADWFTGNKAPAGVTATDYLVVAGGGSGGGSSSAPNTPGGGGGAGGYKTSTALAVTPGNAYTVTVGAGGAGKAGTGNGNVGNNSVFSSITSDGGGYGGGYSPPGQAGGNGGSGGGGAGFTPGAAGSTAGGGQGNNGGAGQSAANASGGGGGANAAGAAGSGGNGGNGGDGTSSSITGSAVTRAGGGGGGGLGASNGNGGAGGGTNGANSTNASSSCSANTGGGSGGSCGGATGDGGSGIIGLSFTASVPTGWYSQFNEPSPQTFQITH